MFTLRFESRTTISENSGRVDVSPNEQRVLPISIEVPVESANVREILHAKHFKLKTRMQERSLRGMLFPSNVKAFVKFSKVHAIEV